MTRRARILIAVAFCVAGLGTVLVILEAADSHRTNPRYLMWKHHLYWYEPQLALRFLNVDADFRMSLIGKSKAEVERWFPHLRPVDPNDPAAWDYKEIVLQPGFLWIDQGNWGIIFENGKVKDIILVKG